MITYLPRFVSEYETIIEIGNGYLRPEILLDELRIEIKIKFKQRSCVSNHLLEFFSCDRLARVVVKNVKCS